MSFGLNQSLPAGLWHWFCLSVQVFNILSICSMLFSRTLWINSFSTHTYSCPGTLFNSISIIIIHLHHAFGHAKILTEINIVLTSFQADSLLVLSLQHWLSSFFNLGCTRRCRLIFFIHLMGRKDLNMLKWTCHPLPNVYLNLSNGQMVRDAVSKHVSKVVSSQGTPSQSCSAS